ncbi:MAG: hypothetical protein LBI03_08310, partial [Clostridiales bacterium]|nr:hypothetical protein [Clostridiales bacterium]
MIKNEINTINTYTYYESWLGEPGCLSGQNSCHFIYSQERNVLQQGYGAQCGLYVWSSPEKLAVSYGDAAIPKIEDLKKKLITAHETSNV